MKHIEARILLINAFLQQFIELSYMFLLSCLLAGHHALKNLDRNMNASLKLVVACVHFCSGK